MGSHLHNILEYEIPERSPRIDGTLPSTREQFKRDKTEENPSEGEINFTEPSSLNEGESALGLPRGLRRLWGATFLLMFLACLAYGSEMALDYIFKEYRWVIGTTNPWTSQLQFATLSASSIAGIATMISTLKTGLFLLKD